jgi:putative N6-adenine-specific DNA methylase
VAVRVLLQLGKFAAPSDGALYDGVRAIDWRPYLDAKRTLVVSAACRSSALTHTQFIAQRTKDAIVDQLRDAAGARPSVDRDDADVRVFVHLAKDEATVYVDLAGEPLHRRGFRGNAREAPLKETLAAAVLLLTGYDGTLPLFDPMCGAGTIPIEAAMIARRIAPGSLRARFGCERWKSHGEAETRAFKWLRDEAQAGIVDRPVPVLGADADRVALDLARENAKRAGVTLELTTSLLEHANAPTGATFVVTNPPYGVRIHGIGDVPRDLGGLIARSPEATFGVLAGAPDVVRFVKRKPDKTWALFNGDIECRLLRYAPV